MLLRHSLTPPSAIPYDREALDARQVCYCAGLGEIFDVRDKAVVITCMHVFCLACLSRWSALKRTCPLCKVSRHSEHSFSSLHHKRILIIVLLLCLTTVKQDP